MGDILIIQTINDVMSSSNGEKINVDKINGLIMRDYIKVKYKIF